VIGPEERLGEEVYLGLRTTDGLAIRENEIKTVTPWIEAGWGELVQRVPEGGNVPAEAGTGRTLRLTALGWLRLDSLAAAIAAGRSR
jgi:coproporphyrinogen III oxidase-like Fe-S oxidoreductase